MAARKTASHVPAHKMSEVADVEDDETIRRRVASGDLVPLPRWGNEPPVREHILAQLRANLAAPKKAKPAD